MRRGLARRLRHLADRIDPRGAPRAIGWSFTFEAGRGIVFREGRSRGCPLWYVGEADYARAHSEAENPSPFRFRVVDGHVEIGRVVL